ncbi:MAG: GatB/YqeY domain-containing protein [Candidatus Vogelbacteria bacterium]|nr:GatB/YqeY domain-containing protein [Candidatus Vogelbacteria bacterium]
MLHEEIRAWIKTATLAREKDKLGVFRGLIADFTNELVARRRIPTELLSDEDALEVIKRAVKRRLDSIEQFTKGGRSDLAESEEIELRYLKAYLPQMMSRNEIRPIAEKKKVELNITDKMKSGILVGAILKELKGKADGTDVKAVVDSLF